MSLPTKEVRRRSIFDDQDEGNKLKYENLRIKQRFPDDKAETYYPTDYVEKVLTEIQQWKMHVAKTLQEKQKFKLERKRLQDMTVDENILSSRQRDIIASFNCDEYLRRVQDFCSRATIITRNMQYKPDDDLEKKYLFMQRILDKQSKN